MSRPSPERCPQCNKHFGNLEILVAHINNKHSLTFRGTIAADGRSLQLTPTRDALASSAATVPASSSVRNEVAVTRSPVVVPSRREGQGQATPPPGFPQSPLDTAVIGRRPLPVPRLNVDAAEFRPMVGHPPDAPTTFSGSTGNTRQGGQAHLTPTSMPPGLPLPHPQAPRFLNITLDEFQPMITRTPASPSVRSNTPASPSVRSNTPASPSVRSNAPASPSVPSNGNIPKISTSRSTGYARRGSRAPLTRNGMPPAPGSPPPRSQAPRVLDINLGDFHPMISHTPASPSITSNGNAERVIRGRWSRLYPTPTGTSDNGPETAESEFTGQSDSIDDMYINVSREDLPVSFEGVDPLRSSQEYSQISAGNSSSVSAVNSVFDSPLLRHSTPQPSVPTALTQPGIENEAELSREARRNTTEFHSIMNGQGCDPLGNILPYGSMPYHRQYPGFEDWSPFFTQQQFELADESFRKEEMSEGNFNKFMKIWSLPPTKSSPRIAPPFSNYQEMLRFIDSSTIGVAPWYSSTFSFNAAEHDIPEDKLQSWMTEDYKTWFRDPRKLIHSMLRNPLNENKIDFAPYRKYDSNGDRQYGNFFSGDWCWREADKIVATLDEEVTKGAMLLGVGLGSDKTTVSVATGQNEYYPLYLYMTNLDNETRRSHDGGVELLAFLPTPKSDRDDKDEDFRKYRRHLLHRSISCILEPLKPYMTEPDVVYCADGFFRRVIYSISSHIADYPEQVDLGGNLYGWCSCCTLPPHTIAYDNFLGTEHVELRERELTDALIALNARDAKKTHGINPDVIPYTNDFPRADIAQILTPDLLHQVIKGTFKDHNVDWLRDFFVKKYSDHRAKQLMDELDRRLSLAPTFTGIRRFPHGRDFKQWTGDDSKGLMKIILPCLVGLVPVKILLTFRSLLECCYLIRRDVLTDVSITSLEYNLKEYHRNREVFREAGVRKDFSLPRQHALFHYPRYIQLFGAPNGICSSITESKHIEAVKKPWRRSNRHEALEQILTTNERIGKLKALRREFTVRGYYPAIPEASDEDESAESMSGESNNDDFDADNANDFTTSSDMVKLATRAQKKYPRQLQALGVYIMVADFSELVRNHLFRKLYPGLNEDAYKNIPPAFFPVPNLNSSLTLSVFNSARVSYLAPSNPSTDARKTITEVIRSTSKWRNTGHRYDTVFVRKDAADDDRPVCGMADLRVGRVYLLFTAKLLGDKYDCALVHWFDLTKSTPDEFTGMYEVAPSHYEDDRPIMSVIDIQRIYRAAHLMPNFGEKFVRRSFKHTEVLEIFEKFFINKYVDHHAHEFIF